VREPILFDRILQRLRDMILSHQIVEGLRPIFARENLVAHAFTLSFPTSGERRKEVDASRRGLWPRARGDPAAKCRFYFSFDSEIDLCRRNLGNVSLEVKVDAASGRVAKEDKRRGAASTFLFNAFDPAEPIAHLAGNLPHWRQDGATYFVTFRTSDSLPQEKLRQWLTEREKWLRENPEPHSDAQRREYWELFPARFQYWLDQGYGGCALGQDALRTTVENALRHFGNELYKLLDCVVMPNHVHVLVAPFGEHLLSSIVQSWKSFTAHKINNPLKHRGAFWQKESFDHIVRSTESLEKFREYIEANRKCRRDFQSRVS
jgi:REP element-mobilizing transposase RayT